MPHQNPTLADLFPFTPHELSDRLSSALDSGQEATKGWTAPVRRMVVDEAARRFGELLDVGLVDIMAGTWAKYAALRRYADPEKYPPDESVLVPLATHRIDSKHAPEIAVVMNSTPLMTLTFTIDLALNIKSAILRIQKGRIREIRPGEVDAAGTIAFSSVVLVERKSATLALAGSIDLGEGVALRPGAASRVSGSVPATNGN